jgi:glycosyltransferase involved in cell wall biosynthesis
MVALRWRPHGKVEYAAPVTLPRVLFVSKPLVPPWHDGSKNLVRDLARHVRAVRPTVLVPKGASAPGESMDALHVYRTGGRFAPGLAANARVLFALALGRTFPLWHFVFAPNPVSSHSARGIIAAQRAAGWQGKVVQTIASAPRDFRLARTLMFGDHIVALSEWMRGRLLGAGVQRRITVIPPCVPAPPPVSEERVAAARAALGCHDDPIVVFPGDYEVSSGAHTFAEAIIHVAREAPSVCFVFACRPKTKASGAAKESIARIIESAGLSSRVRHVGEIDDMHALLRAAQVVAFPVDDLYGKVDVPLVLIEALALGVPMVVAQGGPLEALTSAALVPPADPDALARALLALLSDPALREVAIAQGHALYEGKFTPERVAARHDAVYEELLAER